MVDFAELRRRSYESASPEEKARIDAYWAREARWDETRSTIKAYFERSTTRPVRKAPDMKRLGLLNRRPSRYATPAPAKETETVIVKAWEKDIPIRIEDVENDDGTFREVLVFKEAVTGSERYTLDDHFIQVLLDPEENRQRPRFYICAGRPDDWDACYVVPADVEAYLRERRPHLFPEHAPTAAP